MELHNFACTHKRHGDEIGSWQVSTTAQMLKFNDFAINTFGNICVSQCSVSGKTLALEAHRGFCYTWNM